MGVKAAVAIMGSVIAGILGCSSGTPERCISAVGAVYPFGDSAVQIGPGRTRITLSPDTLPSSGGRFRIASSQDEVGNRQTGTWLSKGDSLLVFLYDVFTTTQLRLHVRSRAVSGTATGTTDQLTEDSAGFYSLHDDKWNVSAQEVICATAGLNGRVDP